MSWAESWDDIHKGGNPRWRVTDARAHEKALSHFTRHLEESQVDKTVDGPLRVFCPLAGDDAFVHLLWKQGHSVVSIDLVPSAVAAMRSQFDGDWAKEERDDGTVVWKHESGRATLYQGDALQSRSELIKSFDAAYDKDSFGALDVSMRTLFCKRIAEYTKDGSIVYIEVKLKDNHDEVKDVGPPYSLKEKDLMEKDNYGEAFDYVEALGFVYDLARPGISQTGHVMKRKDRK